MDSVLDQLKRRRMALKITQEQMMLRAGMSRQQYQRLESQGNPTLKNLELVAKGLKMELMLVPSEKLQAVKAVLEGKSIEGELSRSGIPLEESWSSEDPWKDLLDVPND